MRFPSGDQNGYLQSYEACVTCADAGDERRRVRIWRIPLTSAAYAMVCPSGDQAGNPSYPGSVANGVKRSADPSPGCGSAIRLDRIAPAASVPSTAVTMRARLQIVGVT